MAGKRKVQSRKPKPAFRGQVEAEVVDQLLYRFVALVRRGLELLLTEPSELAEKEFRQSPDLLHSAADIPALVLWTALAAYELPWAVFCQQVLAQPRWTDLLGLSSQAELEALYAALSQWEPFPVRLIELAVHDGLKEGDKQDRRPEAQRPASRGEYAKYIGVTRVLKLLKKQLRPFLKQLDAQDPKRPRHRPRTYHTRSFLLADLLRWMLSLPSTDELIRKLEQHADLAGAVNFKPGEIPSKSTFSRRRLCPWMT